MADVNAIFEQMPEKFNSDKAAGVTVTYQFDLSADDSGKWFAKIVNGELTVGEGEDPDADVSVIISGANWMKIAEGALNSQMAFMTGKLKIKGDMGMAMKLQTLFNL